MNFRSIFLEALLIALGVVLGLAANEWRSDRVAQENAVQSLASIREELAHNRELVVASRDYHGSKQGLLRQLGPGATPAITDFDRGFINPAQVLDTAWEVAKLTDALSHLPLSTVLLVSEAYELQGAYDNQSHTFGSVLYEALYRDGRDSVLANHRNLAMILGAFWYRENGLVTKYDEILSALEPAE